MDVRRALAALSEPTRFRIVELLDGGPRTVGEVAQTLGARQPATTKHVQVLEAAGVVVVHPLGRRRVVALRRDAVQGLADWFGARAGQVPDESVLHQYRARIEAEEARTLGEPRRFRFQRRLPAGRPRVWLAWTDERALGRWWAPHHFEVADCEVHAQAGGGLRIVLCEADGAEYVATGAFTAVDPPISMSFTLSPLDADGEPLFTAGHVVTLQADAGETVFEMTIEVGEIREGAASALAGVEIGWNQQLDRLAALLAEDPA